MSRDEKGFGYQLYHSLWMGWLLTFGFANWVAFLFIGLRVRHKRWVGWGVLYALPALGVFLFTDETPGFTTLENAVMTAWFMGGLGSLVHGFFVRKEYMLRLEAHERTHGVELKRRVERDYGVDLDAEPGVEPPSGPQVDVNNASEAEIAELPGVGVVLAEIAVQLRQTRGAFDSADEFIDALGLDGPLAERLRPRVLIRPMRGVGLP